MKRDAWRLHGCQRCGGDEFKDMDEFGHVAWTCLMCGRSHEHEVQTVAPHPVVVTEEVACCA